MFEKINISRIVRDHVSTLRDYHTKRYRPSDFFLFFGFPAVVAAIVLYFCGVLGSSLITIVATSLSIFAALLFNLLLLTYDAIRKTNDTGSSDTLRRDFLRELFSNISFAIFVAIIAIVLVLVLVLLDKATVAQNVFSFFIYYLVSVFVLTLLMVLKRMHVLLAKEFDTD